MLLPIVAALCSIQLSLPIAAAATQRWSQQETEPLFSHVRPDRGFVAITKKRKNKYQFLIYAQ